jgi:anthranilate phosphoribosyltransferase
MVREAGRALVERGHLGPGDLRRALETILQGRADPVDAAAFLTALRLRGETAEHLAEAVTVLREHMVPLDAGGRPVLDTCGTGGDGSGTFNVSTATALVVAACGVPVVKHGNRGATSASGSADVLAALGVNVECDPAVARRCLDAAGLAFCFAPRFHPAMRHVAPVRRQLGFRTLFNLVGPLTNPARAPFQLLGVGHADRLDVMADALARLGVERAYLVHGSDGLDEVTLGGPTAVRLVSRGTVQALEWRPADFGLPVWPLTAVRVDGPAASAASIGQVLAGAPGPALDLVLANAAAALHLVGQAGSLADGVIRARAAIAAGAARRVLEQLRETTAAGSGG